MEENTVATFCKPALRYYVTHDQKHNSDWWQRTTLGIACRNNELEKVKHLVEIERKDPNENDEHGNTLIHIAAMNGCLDVLKYLIEEQHGKSGVECKCGGTPIHAACQKNDNLAMVQYLVEEKGEDPNKKDENGNAPIHIAVMYGSLDILKYLIEQCNCNSTSRGEFSGSLLHHACNRDIVKYLVEQQNFDPYEKDDGGETSLSVAAFNRRLDILQYLVGELKCNPNYLGMWNRTPLHDASQRVNNLPVVEYLVEHGGDMFYKDVFGFLPVDVATTFGNESTICFLKQKMGLPIQPVTPLLPPGSLYAFEPGSYTQFDYVDQNQQKVPIHHPNIKENLGPMLRDWNYSQKSNGDITFFNTKVMVSINEDPRAVAERYVLALQEGYVKASFFKALVIGSAGVGKTHFLHRLFNTPPPEVRNSTAMLVRPMQAIQTMCKQGKDKILLEPLSNAELYKLLATEINKNSATSLPFPGEQNKESVSFPSSTPEQSNNDHAEEYMSPPHFNSKDFQKTDFADKMIPCIATYKDDPLLEINWVYFIDSGGQPQFHELLSHFMYNTDLNIFVFRLCDKLNDNPTILFYERDSLLHSSVSVLSNTEIMQRCIQATQTLDEGILSKLLILGTHRDKVNECEGENLVDKNNMLKRLIPSAVKQKVIYNSDDVIFPLNAKEPDDDDKTTISKITDRVFKSRKCATEIPIRWLVFHQELLTLQSDLVSYSYCLQTAERLHIPEEDIIPALTFFSNLNVILYYPKILPHVIFANPQALFNIITEIIKIITCARSDYALDFDHVSAYKKGCLSVKYLDFLKEKLPPIFKDGLFELKDMITLFEHLNIVCKLKKKSDEYFMPSLLKGLKRKELDKELNCSLQMITHGAFYYKERSFRCGEYSSLITSLLSLDDWELAYEGDELNFMCVYSNCIKMFYGVQIVTLVDAASYLEVQVTSNDIDHCKEMRVCSKVKQNIQNVLNSGAKWAFVCPCKLYQTEKHLAVECDGVWSCSRNRSRTFKMSEDGHLPEVLCDCSIVVTMPLAALGSKPELRMIYNLPLDDWHNVGIELGIPENELKVIQKYNVGDFNAQKREMLSTWLRQDVKATYRKLVEVLMISEGESVMILSNRLGFSLDPFIPSSKSPNKLASVSNDAVSSPTLRGLSMCMILLGVCVAIVAFVFKYKIL